MTRMLGHGVRSLACAVGLALAACGTTPAHKEEAFDAETPFQHRLPVELERACEGARLALLSQGYIVDDSRALYLKGNKSFQPDEDIHYVIEFQVVCAMTRGGTTLYANAVETRYDLKASSQAAGISIPSVGSLRLPWGGGKESLVKVGAETVKGPDFYQRFFRLVDRQLGLPDKPE